MSIDLALDKMIKVPKYPYFRILFILSFLLISACSNKDEIDPVTGKQKFTRLILKRKPKRSEIKVVDYLIHQEVQAVILNFPHPIFYGELL